MLIGLYNPFNRSTTIQFQVPQDGHVMLIIYNLLGQQVATLVDRNLRIGMHQVIFDATKFSSGHYFYRMKTKDYSQMKKMMLIK